MKKLLVFGAFLFIAITGCKKTTTSSSTQQTAGVMGELHYRTSCQDGLPAPVIDNSYFGTWAYLTDGTEAVGVPSRIAGGYFYIANIVTTGTFTLHIGAAQDHWLFAPSGATLQTMPVTVDQLGAISLGKICINNDPPKIDAVKLTFADGTTSSAATQHSALHLPPGVLSARLHLKGSDPDGHAVTYSVYAKEGTIETVEGRLEWIYYPPAGTGTVDHIFVEADDGQAGTIREPYGVIAHESLLAPAFKNYVYEFSNSVARYAMQKSTVNSSGLWSNSSCCLAAIQYYTRQTNLLEAKAVEELKGGFAITAETTLTVLNLAGNVEFGLRLTDTTATKRFFDLVVGYKNGLVEYRIKENGALIGTGPISLPFNSSLQLKLEIVPATGLLNFVVAPANSAASVGTYSITSDQFGRMQSSLRVESFTTTAENAAYLEFVKLALWGAEMRYQVPARYGVFNQTVYNQLVRGEGTAFYIVAEDGVFTGSDFVEAGLRHKLHRVLVTTDEGRKLTVLTDNPERLFGWMPPGSTVDFVELEALAPFDRGQLFAY